MHLHDNETIHHIWVLLNVVIFQWAMFAINIEKEERISFVNGIGCLLKRKK